MEHILPEQENAIERHLSHYITKTNKKDYKKEWRLLNSDHIKQYQKQYLEKNNSTVECNECMVRYKKYNKLIHDKTKRHLQVVERKANDKTIAELNTKICDLQNKLHDIIVSD